MNVKGKVKSWRLRIVTMLFLHHVSFFSRSTKVCVIQRKQFIITPKNKRAKTSNVFGIEQFSLKSGSLATINCSNAIWTVMKWSTAIKDRFESHLCNNVCISGRVNIFFYLTLTYLLLLRCSLRRSYIHYFRLTNI